MDTPSVPHHVPRHRPGHRSRVHDLDRRIKAAARIGDIPSTTPSTDPLCGNYAVVRLEDILVAYPGIGEAVTLQALPVKPPTKTAAASLACGSTHAYPRAPKETAQGRLAVTAADFDGDGRDEAAVAYVDDPDTGPCLRLVVVRYDEAGGAFDPGAPDADPVVSGAIDVKRAPLLAAGVLGANEAANVSPRAQLVTAYATPAGTLNIALWDLSSGVAALLAHDDSIAVTGAFDIALADLDGDGVEELSVLWQGAADQHGNTLFLRVLRWGHAGQPRSPEFTSVTDVPVGQASGAFVSLAGGNMDPNVPGRDQLAVAWGSSAGLAGTPNLLICGLDPGSAALKRSTVAWADAKEYPLVDAGILRVAVGDVNQDGIDEVVLGTQGTYTDTKDKTSASDVLILRCFKVDGLLNPTLSSQGHAAAAPGQSLLTVDLQLAIGAPSPPGADDDATLLNSVVVACVGSDTMDHVLRGVGLVTVAAIQMGAGPDFPSALTAGLAELTENSPNHIPVACFDGAQGKTLADLNVALALGDFGGRTIRVGPPQYFRAEAVNGPIAVLNAPPTQYLPAPDVDEIPLNTFASIQTRDEQESSLGMSVHRDWTTSSTLDAKLKLGVLGDIDRNITTTYGKSFEKSTEQIKSLTTGLTAQAQQDDMILLSVTDYDVWEYPVFQGTSEPLGHILVVFPDVPPQGLPGKSLLAGLDKQSTYAPPHQVQQVMSYPRTDPADYLATNAVFAGTAVSASTNMQQNVDVAWDDVKDSSGSTSRRVDLNVSTTLKTDLSLPCFLPGVDLGLSLNIDDQYAHSKLSTHDVEFVQSTTIAIQIGQLEDQQYEYRVTPMLYWSTYGNYLVLDWIVATSPTTYWADHYAEAQPTLRLGWNKDRRIYGSSRPGDQLLTRSVAVFGTGNGQYEVRAVIANYGAKRADGVTLDFFALDDLSKIDAASLPAEAKSIGATQNVAPIAPFSTQTAAVAWTPPEPSTPYAVYCKINADGNGDKVGYNMYPPDYFQRVEPSSSDGTVGAHAAADVADVGATSPAHSSG